MLLELQPELLCVVADCCSPVSLLNLALVSRMCRTTSEDERIWKALLPFFRRSTDTSVPVSMMDDS